MSTVSQHANLVIVGAGIVGCSVAYHLTQLGWKDIVVLDQGPLFETGGSTSHAPGITFGTNASYLMQKMAKYTTDLLHGMSYQGEQVWFPVGSIEVARSKERVEELWRRHGHATSYGIESHIISPEQVGEMVPLIDPGTFTAGLYRPSDGNAKAWKAAGALGVAAMESGGATFLGETAVEQIHLRDGRVSGIATNKGRIECDQVLLCTNIWASVLADKIGVSIPMMACSHHYGITEPLPEYDRDMAWIQEPPVRYQEKSMYFRQWERGYCVGSYRHEPWIVNPYQVGRDAYWHWREQAFQGAARDALDLYPTLEGREYATKVNGMFVFSVDGYPIMGPAQVDGCWMAIGIWVTHAGGAGKSIAEWIDRGYTEWDMREADANRFHAHQQTLSYIRKRSTQNYREVYDLVHPLQQMTEPRNMRLAPHHQRLVEQEGHFFSVSGWEVAQWYEANACLLEEFGDQIPDRSGWEAIEWSRIQGAEHLAVRQRGGPHDRAWIERHKPEEGVAIRDLTSQYTAIGLWGPRARDLLAKVAEEQVSNEAFPYMTAQPLQMDGVPVLALRLSYVGELGWEIYCPSEMGLALWDILWQAGREYGFIAAGAGSFGSLRLEKGYRAWGADIHTEYNAYEAGLGWAVRFEKGDFLGREALLKQRQAGIGRKFSCLTSTDAQAMALGKEPILSEDGEPLGYVTSADYGYLVGKFILYGYLPLTHTSKGTVVQIRYFDRKFNAVVDADPLFDPRMKRLKI